MSKDLMWLCGLLIVAVGAAAWYLKSVNPEVPEPMTTRIAFVTGGSGPFWQLAVNGATAAAKEYNAQLIVETPDSEEGVQEQNMILSSVKTKGFDAVAVSPLRRAAGCAAAVRAHLRRKAGLAAGPAV